MNTVPRQPTITNANIDLLEETSENAPEDIDITEDSDFILQVL